MSKPKVLSALVQRLGPHKTATRLGVSVTTVRRALSSGNVSGRLGERATIALRRSDAAARGWETRREQEYLREERAGITEAPQVVPGYGPQKLTRVLAELRALRGELWVEHQHTKYSVRRLEKLKVSVDPALAADMARLERLEANIRKLEFHMAPSETLEEHLFKVDNIDREYIAISRQFNMSARAIYSLYYSPPAGAAATAPPATLTA